MLSAAVARLGHLANRVRGGAARDGPSGGVTVAVETQVAPAALTIGLQLEPPESQRRRRVLGDGVLGVPLPAGGGVRRSRRPAAWSGVARFLNDHIAPNEAFGSCIAMASVVAAVKPCDPKASIRIKPI